MSLVRNTISLLATTAIITPMRLLVVIVLARLLSPEELGVYSITLTFAAISMLTLQIGLPSSAIFRIRRLGHGADQVASSVFTTSLLLGGIGVCVLLAAEPLIAGEILPPDSGHIYRIGIGIAVLQLLGSSFVGVARGIDRFDLANAYRLIAASGELIGLTVVLAFVSSRSADALSVVLIVYLISAGTLVASVVWQTGFDSRDYFTHLGPGLRYGAKSHAQTLAGNFHEQVDVFMLAVLLSDPAQIAVYSIAVGVLNRTKLIPLALADALFPEVAARSPEDGAALAAQATRHGMLGVSLFALAVALAAPLLVPLVFGETYRSAVPVLWILAPGMIMLAIFLLIGRYFMAINRQQVSVKIQAVALVTNIGLNVMLIPEFGIIGAAIASLISYAMEFLAIVVAFVRTTDRTLSDCLVFKRGDFVFYLSRLRQLRSRAEGSTGGAGS